MVEEKSSRNSEEGFWSSLARILTVVTYAYQHWAISAENKFITKTWRSKKWWRHFGIQNVSELWRREPEQTKRPEVAFRCSYLCTHSIWPKRDVSTVQWFLCSHLMHRKFLASSFPRSTKVFIIIAIISFSYFFEFTFFIFFVKRLGIAIRVKYVHQRQRRFQITLQGILEL